MNTRNNTRGSLRHAARQRGFTLVELMVTVGIALFLLGGLVTILQNVRQANLNQQALAQLQDQQRFAMTVISDMIQQAGYYPSYTETQSSAMGANAPFAVAGHKLNRAVAVCVFGNAGHSLFSFLSRFRGLGIHNQPRANQLTCNSERWPVIELAGQDVFR